MGKKGGGGPFTRYVVWANHTLGRQGPQAVKIEGVRTRFEEKKELKGMASRYEALYPQTDWATRTE